MNEKITARQIDMRQPDDEAGQSLVLIAVTLFFLIMIVGLATDAGFLFAKVAEFGAAVDSAATAGVVDLSSDDGVAGSRDRARQFLVANGWPQSSIVLTGTSRIGDFGIPEFSITVTAQLETFFMRSLGFETLPVTRAATAAYFAQTDLLVSTAFDRGILNISSQFAYGPENCTQTGDPISPIYAADATPNIDYPATDGVYSYRIYLPEDYALITDTVYVSLFDPDAYNGITGNTGHVFEHVDGNSFADDCVSNGDGDQCVIKTGDLNSLWLIRVDETYGAFDTVNEICPSATPTVQSGDTVTVYELYVLDPNTNDRTDVAAYTSSNNAGWETDLKWVTPGVDAGINTDYGSFSVNLGAIPANAVGDRYLYVDVYTTGGTAKNVWDLWAGPTAKWTLLSVYPNVNDRNLEIWRSTPTLTETLGLEVFAIGRLPQNTFISGEQIIPLVSLDTSASGGTIYATVFDHDGGATTPVELTISTVAISDFFWELDVDCGGSCDNQWVLPQPSFGVPDLEEDGIPFFGGILLATYDTAADEHTWYINISSGRPFLTR